MSRIVLLHFLAIFACVNGIKTIFQNITLMNGEEKPATNLESDNNSLPNQTVNVVRAIGYIPIWYEHAIVDVQNVMNLEFRNNQATEIQPRAFKSFDDVASLEITFANFTLLRDSNIGWLTINAFLLERAEVGTSKDRVTFNVLSIISATKLAKLEDGVFQNLNVGILLLNCSGLRIFPENVFRNLTSLQGLLLRGNGIEHLQNEVFEGLPVEGLDLSENFISTIPQSFFTKMEKLEMAYLSKNRFTTIPSGVFTNHQQLKLVDLSHNDISFVASEAFDNMPNLERVVFDSNNLTNIDPRWFYKTGKIISLDFMSNSIIEIPNEAFVNVYNEQLSKIDLSENNIKTVYPNAFKGLKKIGSLGLSSNNIEKWNANYLPDVDEIGTLHLEDNSIECPEGNFDEVFKAQYTSLSANPLDSNCSKKIEEWQGVHFEHTVKYDKR